MERIKQIINEWLYDLINGFSWAAILSVLKYFGQHFLDIGWSVACALITTWAVHKLNNRLKKSS